MLAVAVAVTAWAYFHFSAAPGVTAHFDQQLTVPIVVTGLPPGFAAEYADHTAIVTIEAPRSGGPIKPDQIEAVVDVSDRSLPGIVNLPVKLVAPELVVKSLAPASVTVAIDRLAARSVPVSIDYTGGDGHLVVVSSTVSPAATTVRGTSGALAKIAGLRVEVPLAGSKPGELDEMVRPVPQDAGGGTVAGVDVSPNLVRLRARFAAATNSAGVRR